MAPISQEQTVRRTFVFLIAVQLGLSALPTSASAQSVEELARRGAELFQAGNFREAAQVLQQAYDTEAVPVLLYNIARAYQQDGRCFMASNYFGRYLDSGDAQALSQAQEHEPGETECANQYSELMSSADDALNSGQLDRAEALISEALDLSDEPAARIMYEQTLFHLGRCEDAVEYISNTSGETDFSAVQNQELDRDLSRATECVEGRRCSEEREQCEDRNQQLITEASASFNQRRMISYIVGGVGAGLLIGAIIHDAVSQNTIDDYENAALRGNVAEYNSLRDDIDGGKTLSWILYGVGAAGVITGVVLFFTAKAPDSVEGVQDCSGVCWDFGIGTPSGGAGAWVSGRF